MGAPLSWAEFLEGMANDKGTWPKQGVRPCFISGCDCANFVSPSPKKEG